MNYGSKGSGSRLREYMSGAGVTRKGYNMSKDVAVAAPDGDPEKATTYEPGDWFMEDGKIYGINPKGKRVNKSYRDVITYLEKNDLLSVPNLTGGESRAGIRAAAGKGVKDALERGDMEALAEYIDPDKFEQASLAIKGMTMRKQTKETPYVDTKVTPPNPMTTNY